MSDTDNNKIEALGGILSRHVEILIDLASKRSKKLADIISSADKDAKKRDVFKDLSLLKRTIDKLSGQVRTNAIPTILLNYVRVAL